MLIGGQAIEVVPQKMGWKHRIGFLFCTYAYVHNPSTGQIDINTPTEFLVSSAVPDTITILSHCGGLRSEPHVMFAQGN